MTEESNNPGSEATNEGPASEPSPWAPRPETSAEPEPQDQPSSSDTPAASDASVEAEPATSTEPAASGGAPPVSRRGLPTWLLVLFAAVIPAVVVGLAVYFLAGNDSSGGSDKAAGIVEGFLRLVPDTNTQVNSYKEAMPANFPPEFPTYEAADPVVSFEIVTPEGTSFFAVLTTQDSIDDVFTFFRTELDLDPWQVEIGQSSSELVGVQFSRPDNASVSGIITVHHSDLDEVTSIFLSYEDISAALTPGTGGVPFVLGTTKPLPADFPEDVPIYAAEESVVVDTYFQRGQGGRLFAVTFLTPDTQDDVIDFYTAEFERRGWNVSDAGVLGTSFALSIDFDDGAEQSISGTITADSFDDDPSFTSVELLIQVSPNRN